ncbi:hypothetical protein BGW36DRAFT_396196 [Talaromyces proteolyticus]|uniref:LysM domain-containing protein n=1 Tax=Talaromyces proteolyticus TaxID=1131652 RepID=A0AAD4KXQ4_9EURO|nr:uncharacterized protein BGW36DRAFT_396196 [Talaromyces proteolyticus]KAH8698406.1 hypothetical protein BGW36DRAFT_396196 [Talaromyces proteolyticus]
MRDGLWLWLSLATGYLVSPLGTAYPETTSDYSDWVEYTSGLTYAGVEEIYSIIATEFKDWVRSCSLSSGVCYCAQISFVSTAHSSTTPTSQVAAMGLWHHHSHSTPIQSGVATNCARFYQINIVGYTPTSCVPTINSTTTAGNGIPTPTPIQSGMVTDCDQFHFVISRNTCAGIASSTVIPVSDFYTWNPTVSSNCSSLWLGYYVCIDIIGYTPSTTAATTFITTTTTRRMIFRPQPQRRKTW